MSMVEVPSAGVRSWHISVLKDSAQKRWVNLTLDFTAASDVDIVGAVLDPADAETIGKALIDYAHQAETRMMADMN